MAINITPPFGLPAANSFAVPGAANLAKDGSGTITQIGTGPGANSFGKIAKKITVTSGQATRAANTAMTACIFLSEDGGTTWNIYDEVAIPATTASSSAIGARAQFSYTSGVILLSANSRIGVTQSAYAGAQDRMVFTLENADY